MFIIYQIGRMSIIMYLPCMVLGSLTGISVNLLIIIMGIIAIIYSYTGGLKSRLHPGICTSDRCYFRTDLPAGTLRRWIWSNHACTYNRA